MRAVSSRYTQPGRADEPVKRAPKPVGATRVAAAIALTTTIIISLLAGCSLPGDSPTTIGHAGADQTLQSDSTSVDRTETPPVTVVGVADADASEAVATYLRFLADGDAAIMGDHKALNRAVSASSNLVVLDLDRQIDQHKVLRETAGLDIEVERVSHVESATSNPDGSVTIKDCVELRQDEPTGTVAPVRFLSQVATMRPADNGWQVDGLLDINPNSGLGGAGANVGCLPITYRIRLAHLASDVISLINRLEREPATPWPDQLDDLVDETAQAGLRSDLGDSPRDRFVNSPLDARVMGAVSDWSAGGYLAQVPVCLRYPEGKTWQDTTGESVPDETLGAPVEAVVLMKIESHPIEATADEPGGFRDQVIEIGEPRPTSCWTVGEDLAEVLEWK